MFDFWTLLPWLGGLAGLILGLGATVFINEITLHGPGPDHGDDGTFLIVFDDPDHAPVQYTGKGAHIAARVALNRYRGSWSCTLYKAIDIPKVKDRKPNE